MLGCQEVTDRNTQDVEDLESTSVEGVNAHVPSSYFHKVSSPNQVLKEKSKTEFLEVGIFLTLHLVQEMKHQHQPPGTAPSLTLAPP